LPNIAEVLVTNESCSNLPLVFLFSRVNLTFGSDSLAIISPKRYEYDAKLNKLNKAMAVLVDGACIEM
jgi:hypothetical protein